MPPSVGRTCLICWTGLRPNQTPQNPQPNRPKNAFGFFSLLDVDLPPPSSTVPPEKPRMHTHILSKAQRTQDICFYFGAYLEQRRRRGRRRKLQHFRRFRGQRGRIGVSYARRCCLPSRRAVSESVSVVGERGIRILDITHRERERRQKIMSGPRLIAPAAAASAPPPMLHRLVIVEMHVFARDGDRNGYLICVAN